MVCLRPKVNLQTSGENRSASGEADSAPGKAFQVRAKGKVFAFNMVGAISLCGMYTRWQ